MHTITKLLVYMLQPDLSNVLMTFERNAKYGCNMTDSKYSYSMKINMAAKLYYSVTGE